MPRSPGFDWDDDDPRWSPPSPYDPPEDEDPAMVPEGDFGPFDDILPLAPDRDIDLHLRPWQTAEASMAASLARAAHATGRLDEAVRRMGHGAATRLAYREVEALSRAEGRWLDRDRIGRAQLEAGSDPHRARDLARARWALRRLTASPAIDYDLWTFLGRHQRDEQALPEPEIPNDARLQASFRDPGPEDVWQDAIARMSDLHPITQGRAALRLWRVLGTDSSDNVLEGAVAAARLVAQENRSLGFAPLAPAGRSWRGGGDCGDVLRLWYAEVRDGALSALAELERVAHWQEKAMGAVKDMGGRNPEKAVSAFAARPYASAADLAEACAISRDTAERTVLAFRQRGLIREITGRGRFRLWKADL